MSVLKKFHAAKRVVRWDRERVITVALTIVGLTLEVASYSVLTPFYPNVAKKKGNDATQIGIVLSVSPFVGFVSSPFIGKMVSMPLSPRDHPLHPGNFTGTVTSEEVKVDDGVLRSYFSSNSSRPG